MDLPLKETIVKWRIVASKVLVPVALSAGAAMVDVGVLDGKVYQAVVGLLHVLGTLFGS